MFIKTLPTTPLQIVCEMVLNSKVMVKSLVNPDNNFQEELLSVNGLRGW